MPLHTYKCRECGEKFDLLVGVTVEKTEIKCKKCKSKNVEKIFGTFSVGGPGGKSNSSGSSCPTGTCSLG